MDFIRAQLQQQTGNVNQAQINSMVEVYANVQPNEPLYQQYISYMISLARGDLGVSMWYDQPVLEILASAIPWTAFVMTISLALTFSLGISLGAVMAYTEGTRVDTLSTMMSIVLNSIPYYVAALVCSCTFLVTRTVSFPSAAVSTLGCHRDSQLRSCEAHSTTLRSQSHPSQLLPLGFRRSRCGATVCEFLVRTTSVSPVYVGCHRMKSPSDT